MQWHSVNEFFHMGGYALYVWGSFGACAVAMLVEPLLLHRQEQAVMRSLRRQQRGQAGGMR